MKTVHMDNRQYRTTSGSILGAIKQRFEKKRRIGTLTEGERIDGKTALITGASSGLGYATAVQLAKRGGHVIMAVRSGIPDKGEAVKQESGSSAVEMRRVDLSDLDSIRSLADGLRNDGIKLDRLVLNAACVPAHSRQTKQGLEEMFVVNFLSSFYLTNLLVQYDVIRRTPAPASSSWLGSPSFLAAHRLGEVRRLRGIRHEEVRASVRLLQAHVAFLRLGALAKNAGRRDRHSGSRALSWSREHQDRPRDAVVRQVAGGCNLRPVLQKDPAKACEPVVYLSCARSLRDRTGVYLHLMEEKQIQAEAADPPNAHKLWEACHSLLEKLGHGI
jgi:hypothetical protein